MTVDERAKAFRLRQLVLIAGWIVMILAFLTMNWSLARWLGLAAFAAIGLAFSAVFAYLLFQRVVSVRQRGQHVGRSRRRPSKEEEINTSNFRAQAAAPPEPVPVEQRPAEFPHLAKPSRPAQHFPWPAGRPSSASLRPWHLPHHPGPAGIAADSALIGGLTIRAASIIGPGHRCEEPATPRQDAYRLGADDAGRYLIVAIADGMSDSAHSDLGANVAADTIVKHLRTVMAERRPTEQDMRDCFGSAAERMTSTAQQRGVTPDDVRAAVLAAILQLNPLANGERSLLLATIADVGAWVRQQRSWRRIAGNGKEGLDAGRLSQFLPHFPSTVRVTSHVLAPGDVLALTTDGIGDAFLASSELAAWFADEWERPPFIGDFVDTVGFEVKGQLDDRTAVVVWCPGRHT